MLLQKILLNPVVIKKLPTLLKPPFPIQRMILDKSINTLLKEQISDNELDFLDGKWLHIEVTDLQLNWFISRHHNKTLIESTRPQADIKISGSSKEFILLASREEDPDTLFFQRRLIIEGDTELGLYTKNLIDSIDIDNLPKVFHYALAKSVDIIHLHETLMPS